MSDQPSAAVLERPEVPPREPKVNDLTIHVATVNGSGSQSSNSVLMRSIFQMGIPVSGKNMFPSNIAGLPTWFTIRANRDGWIARKREVDILVAMNPATARDDVEALEAGIDLRLRRAAQVRDVPRGPRLLPRSVREARRGSHRRLAPQEAPREHDLRRDRRGPDRDRAGRDRRRGREAVQGKAESDRPQRQGGRQGARVREGELRSASRAGASSGWTPRAARSSSTGTPPPRSAPCSAASPS